MKKQNKTEYHEYLDGDTPGQFGREKAKNVTGKFYSLASLERYIRRNGTTDQVKFKGMIFTMDNYDMEGRQITYGNLKHKQVLEVNTGNRYGPNKFKDAKVDTYEMMAWRNDIHYAE